MLKFEFNEEFIKEQIEQQILYGESLLYKSWRDEGGHYGKTLGDTLQDLQDIIRLLERGKDL